MHDGDVAMHLLTILDETLRHNYILSIMFVFSLVMNAPVYVSELRLGNPVTWPTRRANPRFLPHILRLANIDAAPRPRHPPRQKQNTPSTAQLRQLRQLGPPPWPCLSHPAKTKITFPTASHPAPAPTATLPPDLSPKSTLLRPSTAGRQRLCLPRHHSRPSSGRPDQRLRTRLTMKTLRPCPGRRPRSPRTNTTASSCTCSAASRSSCTCSGRTFPRRSSTPWGSSTTPTGGGRWRCRPSWS